MASIAAQKKPTVAHVKVLAAQKKTRTATPKAIRARKLQGQYMGALKSLKGAGEGVDSRHQHEHKVRVGHNHGGRA